MSDAIFPPLQKSIFDTYKKIADSVFAKMKMCY